MVMIFQFIKKYSKDEGIFQINFFYKIVINNIVSFDEQIKITCFKRSIKDA